jgi:hypothetical protein
MLFGERVHDYCENHTVHIITTAFERHYSGIYVYILEVLSLVFPNQNLTCVIVSLYMLQVKPISLYNSLYV